jgi:gliding motility-associated-like protein
MTVNNAAPVLTISSTATSICSGTSVTFTATVTSTVGTPTYQWKLNGSNVGSNSSTYSSSTLANNDIITCVYNDNSPCIPASGVASNSIQMVVTPSVTPTISISASATNICTGTSITFTATSNMATVTYQWKKNGINVGTNSNTYTDNSLNNSDNISCMLTATGACLTSATATSNNISITVFPDPAVILDQTPMVCVGTALDAGDFASYLWSTGSTGRIINITSAGTYSVQVTDNNGCKASGATLITNILPNPSSFLPAEATISCETQSVSASSSQIFSSYLWSTGSILPQINITAAGTYWLEVTNSDGCKAKEYITIKPGNCLVIIPNTFTPNNDNTNDLWLIKGLQRFPACTIEVFDRYGQRVFESVGYSSPWNGTYKGQSIPFGTYYYILDLHDGSNPMKGYVTIIK